MNDMRIDQLVESLADAGVYLAARDGRLVCKAADGALTPERRRLISERKAEFLAFLDRTADAATDDEPALAPRAPGPASLSPAQRRLWFIDRLTGANYTIPVTYRLHGPLDAGLLQRALQRIVDRHESLRSVVALHEGEPVAVIREGVELELAHVDLCYLEPDAQDAHVRACLQDAVAEGFDLEHDLLLRACLFVLAPDHHVLLLTLHHIASDGWSVENLLRELSTLYAAFRAGADDPLPALPLQYADYAAWQLQWLQGARLRRELDYWRDRLAGAPALHGLPTDFPRPPHAVHAGGSWRQQLPADLRDALAELGRRHGATLFMTLQAAFAVLIARWSGDGDVVVGTPVANRPRDELAPLVGFFSNTLALRTSLADDPTFEDALRQARDAALDAYRYQHLPFEVLVEELNPPRSLGHAPLFQIMFSLLDIDEAAAITLPDIQVEAILPECTHAKFDLNLSMFETPAGLEACWDFSRDLFHADTIAQLGASFEVLLRGIVAAPDRRISRLPLLDPAGRARVLALADGGPAPWPLDACLHELVEAQVARTPGAIAVAQDDVALCYDALNRRANRLAHHLRMLGVGPDVPVALVMERSPTLIVALLAVLKAGGCYVPIEPDAPAQRLAWLLADSGAAVVMTHAPAASAVRIALAAVAGTPPLLDLDADAQRWQALPDTNPSAADIGLTPRHLAYVIYTSGSTGEPKGVMVPHRGVANRMLWMQETYPHSGADSVLQKTPIGFDVSVREIFLSLIAGARLVLAQPGGHRDPAYLADLIAREGITVIGFVPSMLQAFLDHPRAAACDSVRLLFSGGEALPAALARRCRARLPHARLHNLYGPTEASVSVTAWDCMGEELPEVLPIGRPGSGVRAYILDPHGEPVPRGVRGEIHLAGCQVARGYLHRPQLTAERFPADPFVAGGEDARMYRSGDLGRQLPDGSIEYLGRNDFQVKIRGQRVELGEIEAQLRGLDGVAQAAVIARDGDAGLQLVAYVVPADPQAARTGFGTRLRQRLQPLLPAHMLPSAFLAMDALPVTANGKLDLKALPPPVQDAGDDADLVAPANALEEELLATWGELLEHRRLGVTSNFFEAGGHSLLLTRLHNRILARHGVELPLRELFAAQTVREQASLLAARQADGTASTAPVPATRPAGTKPVLSYAQRRLWFIDRMGEAGAVYNIPCALRLRGALDVPALQTAVHGLLARHEVLRTTLPEVDGEPVPRVLPPAAPPLIAHDLRALSPDRREAEARRRRDDEAALPFDLARDLFLRAQLLRLDDAEHLLLLTVHHIAADGWSMGVLLRELAALYDAAVAGRPSPLPPPALQYADYAHWQQAWLAGARLETQASYWERQLAGIPAVHNLPLDFPRPDIQRYRGAAHRQRLPAELLPGLQALARRHDATMFMVLHAAFCTLLSRWSGDTDIVVGTPIANRRHDALAPLVGFFVNTLVLRADLTGDPDFSGLLRAVRATALDAYQHQDLPFEMLVDRLRPPRSLAHGPLFQVMLAYEGGDGAIAPMAGLQVEDAASDSHHAKFDLTLNLRETASGLEACWDYNRELFRADTIAAMADAFATLLRGVVADPARPLRRVPLLADAARTAPACGPALPLPDVAGVHALFERRAMDGPAALAARAGDATIDYATLDRRANQVAHALRALGVGADARVALHVERGIDLLVGMLAILKAGGAYVPLDPAHPRERLRGMLRDSGALAVLTQSRLAPLDESGPPRLALDDGRACSAFPGHAPADVGLSQEHLAYVLYTSGSTGAPKGVMVEHRNLLNLVADNAPRFADDGALHASAWTSAGFDVSVFELLVTLALGGTVHFVPETLRTDADALVDWLAAERISHAYLPPFVVQRLRELPDARIAALALRRLLVGVEPLAEDGLHRLLRLRPGLRIVNGYGPTETTVFSTCYDDIRALDRIAPIGRPLANTRIHLLDEALQPVPQGAVGELCIGGAGVARGYLGLPELSAERFVTGAGGERLYRTGDLARWLPEGQLEFRGRRDQQLKINGVRIEPGEIEAALRAHAAVADAAAVARGEDGQRRLVAYVVPAADAALDVERLRTHLAQRLPAYMLPAAFVALARLPLTVNGKLDVGALPAPDTEAYGAGAYAAPATPLESRLAGLWQALLGHERIGVDSSFFDLGGHSLNAVRLMSAIREATGKSLPISTLFRAPTIRALAAEIEAHVAATGDEPLVALREGGGGPPLFVFHAAGGDVLCYQPLLQYLPEDMPVYGLARGELPRQGVPALRSLEDLADEYAARLLRQQPAGPYRLAGWSSGGLLALEVAARLERAGHRVVRVALVDTMLATGAGLSERLRAIGLRGMQALSPEEACALMRDHDPELPAATPRDGLLDIPADAYFNYVVAANQMTIEFHQPAFALEAPVHYFGARRNRNLKTPEQRVAELQALARRPIAYRDFDASHFSIMEEPDVGLLGPALAAALAAP